MTAALVGSAVALVSYALGCAVTWATLRGKHNPITEAFDVPPAQPAKPTTGTLARILRARRVGVSDARPATLDSAPPVDRSAGTDAARSDAASSGPYPRLMTESVFCPDCGCSGGVHGPEGCTIVHPALPTCTHTAEDVVHLAYDRGMRLGDSMVELLATIEDLLDNAVHHTRCAIHDEDWCSCLLNDLRSKIRGAIAERVIA